MTPSNPPKIEYIRGRVCRNCSSRIPKPKKKGGKPKIFCSDNCRKEFNRNSGISVHRLKGRVSEWVRLELRPLEAAVKELRGKLDALEALGDER